MLMKVLVFATALMWAATSGNLVRERPAADPTAWEVEVAAAAMEPEGPMPRANDFPTPKAYQEAYILWYQHHVDRIAGDRLALERCGRIEHLADVERQKHGEAPSPTSEDSKRVAECFLQHKARAAAAAAAPPTTAAK